MLYKKKLDTCFDTNGIKIGVQLWRRRRDLNPRYPFGVYTISNRARSASYATSPYRPLLQPPVYITAFKPVCQVVKRKIITKSVDNKPKNEYNKQADMLLWLSR